jgi:hypothetical protein
MSTNRVLRRIFAPKREKVIVCGREMYNEKQDLRFSQQWL